MPAELPAASRKLVARLVSLVFFMQLLDGTIIATSLPHMAADFGTTPVAMSIGLTAYLLATAMLLPAAGWIGERFGARRVLTLSVTLFILASLACGLAARLDLFIAARVVQGGAAALMAPVGRLLVLRNAPKSELMAAIATITWPALFAPVVGPVLGAWITQTFGWQWNFFINIPLGLIAVVLFLLLVPDQGPGTARRFDARGFVLSAGALACLLGGLEAFTGSYGAVSALALVATGLILGALALRHLRRSPAPLFDLAVTRVPTFRIATMTAGTMGRITANATPFLLPLLFQVGFGLAALAAGQMILVYFLGNFAMKSVTSPILRRFGFRRVLTVNGLIAAVSVGAFAAVPADLPVPLLWALLFGAGATRSLQFTALNTLAFADIGAAARATSSTLSTMAQQIAMVLGVALSVALIRLSEGLRGGAEASLTDFRVAFAGMALLGIVSALSFLSLRRDAGREVSGHGVAEDGAAD